MTSTDPYAIQFEANQGKPMNLKLVPSNSTMLRTRCRPFDFLNPQFDPVEFSQALVRKMYEHNGIGLAANQVGYDLRIFAMRGHPQNFVCFNPRIVWKSEKEVVLEEGCISFPGLLVKIKRPEFVRIRFNTPNGDIKTERYVGMTARCIQHEMDHLNGVVFYEKANRYHRDLAFKNWAKWRKENDKTILRSV